MSYTASSIETLNFKQAIRKRIEMYMGSADNQGVIQCVRETISNSIDEFSIGFGKEIQITVKDNIFTCRDFGRSVPFGKRDDGTEAMVAIFTTPHTGGKFNDKMYGNAVIGQNGIGMKGVALSAEYFVAKSYRDGKCAHLRIENGEVVKFEVINSSEKTGTYIEFKPSQEVYRLEPIKMDYDAVAAMCEDWSYLNKGLKFILSDGEKETIYFSKNGIVDFIKAKVKATLQAEPYLYYVEDENGNKVEIAFQWGCKKEKSYTFTNGLHNLNGGTSLTGAKTAITRTINNLAGQNYTGDFVRDSLCYVINAKVPHASFSDQTKMRVNNPELRQLTDKAFTEGIKEFAIRKKEDFDKIISFLNKIEKAEAAADRAREKVLLATAQVEKNQKKKVFSSDKLKDAEFLGQDSTLLIVEGDSAASSMAMARDIKKYGILAIRGKILNCLAHPEDKIFENDVINLLLSAMNIVPGKYNSSKLRYGRIAICTDSDSDGYHIGLLIMAALRYLAPKFLDEGRLCWLRSPLYIVKNGKSESYYFTDEEMNAARATVKGEVQRNKGLGSLSAAQARESMFNEKNQRMDVLIPDEDSIYLLEELMGEKVEPRRDFIFTNIDFSEIRE